MKRLIFYPAIVCISICNSVAASFQNFGFEESSFPDWLPDPIPGPAFDAGPGEWVRPGWDSAPQTGVGYNYTQLFGGWASILDVGYRNVWQPANPAEAPVVGNFSLGIWPHSNPVNEGVLEPYVLRQTGDVPAGAKSLHFLYQGNNLHVSLGGTPLTIHAADDVPSGNPAVPVFHYFAVDVSAYAGQTAELKFEFRSFGNYPGRDGGRVPGWPDATMHVLDDLSFSPLPAVPEPATWALLGTGGLALLWAVQRRHRS